MKKDILAEPVRYGIVGLGGFGARRRETLRESGAFSIVGGADVRSEAFDKAEKEENCPITRFSSVDELVQDPRIEAVFIATPAYLHLSGAFAAARAGKAVFCEKPLGHDPAKCRELVEYCEKNQIPHGHGFSARFRPVFQEVKRLLEAEALGQIVSVSAATMHTGGLVANPDNWRFRPDENPGGPLFQCGIHFIDTLRFLFGAGRWHAGIVQNKITASPTDDAYVLLGDFGGIPTTVHSHYVASYRHAMEIYGTKGGLFITEFPIKLEIKKTDLVSKAESLEDITASIPQIDAEMESLRDFARAVRERRQPLMNGREGLTSLELVFEAARVSKPL